MDVKLTLSNGEKLVLSVSGGFRDNVNSMLKERFVIDTEDDVAINTQHIVKIERV